MTAARSRHAALSGSQAKAPGFAGGYLLDTPPLRAHCGRRPRARFSSQGAYRSNSAAAAEALPRRTRCRRRCSEPGSEGFARPGSFDDGDLPLLTRPSDNDVLSVRWLPLLW